MKKKLLALLLVVALSVGLATSMTAGAAQLKADVVFVIDSTGSMYDAIQNVKTNVAEFVRYLESLGVNLRIGMIEYRDIEEDGNSSTIVHTMDYSPWYTDPDAMIETLNRIDADGGGDTPESLVDALGCLLDDSTMHFRSDAFRFAVIVTDADSKDRNNRGLKNLGEATDQLVSKGIYSSVITTNSLKSYYSDIYTRTDGIFGNIYSDFAEILKELADRIFGIISTGEGPVTAKDIISVQRVEVNLKRAGIVIENCGKITAEVTPYNASDTSLKWYVDDEAIAVIDGVDGNTCSVRGVAPGSTRVVAVTNDGGYTAATKIYVAATEEELPVFFEDVEVEDWSYPSVVFVSRNALFYGLDEVTFDPNGVMTRGTMVTVLYRLAGEPMPETTASFEDVRPDRYYARPISWALEQGIAYGYSETEFGPEDPITREQMAVMCYRCAQSQRLNVAVDAEPAVTLGAMPDGGDASDWALEGLNWAVTNKLISGKPDGTLAPTAPVTRAEAAVIIQRYCELIPSLEKLPEPEVKPETTAPAADKTGTEDLGIHPSRTSRGDRGSRG